MSPVRATLRSVPVRAPGFPAGTWINTTGPLSLRGLRGRLVLLDFWTFCCVNCLHVIDELRGLEAEFGDRVIVIGVHSPKFEHEKSDRAVRAATARYDLRHAVFNDPGMQLWRQYAVRAWPTLVLINARGYVIAQAAGEGHVEALRLIIAAELADIDPPTQVFMLAPDSDDGDFLFPAKAIVTGDTLLIADEGHHQVVVTDLTGRNVHQRIGDGIRGCAATSFAQPNGLTLLPPKLAARLGYDVLVADTGNHLLRGIRLSDGSIVASIDLAAALDGVRTVIGPIPAVLSPWDVAWWPAIARVVIAAAGVHLLLVLDPLTGIVEVLAGTGVEGLKDGLALDSWLAQPSGLAVDGDRLWFVDAETSSLRSLSADGTVGTAIGAGLFDFGHVDGAADQARLQHPLGLGVLPDGSIAIADTYNGAVRRYDPGTGIVSTLMSGLDEPSGLILAAGSLLVVESGAHRLSPIDWQAPPEGDPGSALPADRPDSFVAPGELTVEVSYAPPPGRQLDDRYGPATRLTVTASPPELLTRGAGESNALSRAVQIGGHHGDTGVLHISAHVASCEQLAEHPACHLARQDWGVPVRISDTGETRLRLVLVEQG